jgi:hypothetical protein
MKKLLFSLEEVNLCTEEIIFEEGILDDCGFYVIERGEGNLFKIIFLSKNYLFYFIFKKTPFKTKLNYFTKIVHLNSKKCCRSNNKN